MTRKESREQAFVLLFEYCFCGDSAEELFDIAEEAGVCVDDEFCKRVVETTIENVSEIDDLISQFAKGWTVKRLSKVVLSALRLAICEINLAKNNSLCLYNIMKPTLLNYQSPALFYLKAHGCYAHHYIIDN